MVDKADKVEWLIKYIVSRNQFRQPRESSKPINLLNRHLNKPNKLNQLNKLNLHTQFNKQTNLIIQLTNKLNQPG